MKQIEDHLREYEDYLMLRNFSGQTRSMYLRTLHHFLNYRVSKSVKGPLREEDAKAYLLYRIRKSKSWSTINCDYSALRKYYREVLNTAWSIKKIPRPRRDHSLPEILSQEDVQRLIEHGRIYKHQVFLTFIYGTGLRLSEALNIKFTDIDGARLQVRVRHGKGGKDRYVQIPSCLLDLLRTYYRRVKPEEYLFNGLKSGRKYSTCAGQWSIKQAKRQAGIKKRATIHTLRHCYATHHIENGTDLVFLQEQLGHKYLKTTAKYVRLCMERYRQINHPLVQMEIKYR